MYVKSSTYNKPNVLFSVNFSFSYHITLSINVHMNRLYGQLRSIFSFLHKRRFLIIAELFMQSRRVTSLRSRLSCDFESMLHWVQSRVSSYISLQCSPFLLPLDPLLLLLPARIDERARGVSGSDPTRKKAGWVGLGLDPTQPSFVSGDPLFFLIGLIPS